MGDKSKTPKKPQIAFADGGAPRFRDVPLTYPLVIDGKRLDKVTVNRLKGAEVANMQTTLVEANFAFEPILDYFVDQPTEVIEALDQDDYMAVQEAVEAFLPQHLKAALEAGREQFLTGELSPSTSPMPSSGDETKS